VTVTVITVLGPVAPETLGVTDAHSHAWIERVAAADPGTPQLTDWALQATGLSTFAMAGGRTLVDCQPGDCGRNANRLAQLSCKTGVHIVACTGFHLRRYYGPVAPLWNMTAEQACGYFETEIRHGLTETRGTDRPVRPGFIKIAAEATLGISPRHLFEAAAQASLSTGYAIEVHTERGADVEAILSFFQSQGVAASRLVFCHVDKRPDFGLHRELAAEGVLLEYDTFLRPKYAPEQHVWPLIDRMLAAGLGRGLALATDMAEHGMWEAIGPVGFVAEVQGQLAARGAPVDVIEQMVGGNITHRLATSARSKEHV